jgi:hypothetical protein
VLGFKKAIEDKGKSDYDTKVKFLALLSSYPKSWVSKLISNVGDTALKDSILAASLQDKGKADAFMTRELIR